jgi:hypothetical protein
MMHTFTGVQVLLAGISERSDRWEGMAKRRVQHYGYEFSYAVGFPFLLNHYNWFVYQCQVKHATKKTTS